jgi:hypothetical protein
MKTLRKIVIVLAVLLLIITAVGLVFFDSHVHAERSIVIDVPRSEMFQMLNTHKTFANWSPWQEKDPEMVVTYSGAESGVGAKYSWNSKVKEVGVGSMEIVESYPDTIIRQKLMFSGKGTSDAGFIFSTAGTGTKVTWTLDMDAGANPLLRIMGGFMDKMIGPDFEHGLSKLKAYAEGAHSAIMVNQ